MPAKMSELFGGGAVPPQLAASLQFAPLPLAPLQVDQPGVTGIELITSATVLVLERPLLDATTVSGYVPGVTEFDVNTFSVDEPAPVIVGGVKVALAFAGTPLTPKLTTPLKPLVAVTVAV